MMFLFLNHHCPGSLSVQTWCSYSWTFIAQVLCAHMMFHFRLNVPGSFWAQTWCSLSRDQMEFVPSEHKHHVPLPEIECTCVRNEGSCAKKPGCSLYGTCFSVCSWWFQGLKYCKPPFTPKQSFSVFKQSFSTLTENLPLHPNFFFFLPLLKTSFYTQSFSIFTENLPWHPNSLFLSLLKNLSLYPIFFCLYWKPPFTPKQYFSIFTENLPWHPNYLFLSLLKTSLHTQTLFFYLYWKPPFTPMQSLLKTSLNSHPNNIFSIFPENLPLYPIFFCLLVYSACRFVQHSFIGVYCSMERRGRYKGKKWMGRAFSSALLQQCQNTSWWSNDQSWAT